MITDHLTELVAAAFDAAAADGSLELEVAPEIRFERPKRKEHGDWATSVALAGAKGAGRPPREVAETLLEHLPPSDQVTAVEIAGPGFMNFRLSSAWRHDVVRRAADPAGGFGRTNAGAGAQVNVEYVSSNPTGPINVVSGRHAAIGDALSNLLEATGHKVIREYYFNDAGSQLRLFGRSIEAHYLRSFGIEAELPEGGYRGDYIADLAAEIAAEDGDLHVHKPPEERVDAFVAMGSQRVLIRIKASLERFGTHFDVWFLERSLHESGALDVALRRLTDNGSVEERDGAVWFRSSRFGDDKDRVLIRSTGAPTYFASDVAYLADKFGRGFDRLIYLWGPDHHGTVPRLLAAAEALGFERERVEVPLVQMITIARGGAALKASKRAGVYVGLDELIDEVGVDAARFTFLTRAMESPLDFDIDIVTRQAPENPVYYVQYAHARISSILRRASSQGLEPSLDAGVLRRLVHSGEEDLMNKLAAFEEALPEAAALRAPQRIVRYVEELAAVFSAFYRDCKVISEDTELTQARLALCVATKAVIADGLGLLGVSAPEKM